MLGSRYTWEQSFHLCGKLECLWCTLLRFLGSSICIWVFGYFLRFKVSSIQTIRLQYNDVGCAEVLPLSLIVCGVAEARYVMDTSHPFLKSAGKDTATGCGCLNQFCVETWLSQDIFSSFVSIAHIQEALQCID